MLLKTKSRPAACFTCRRAAGEGVCVLLKEAYLKGYPQIEAHSALHQAVQQRGDKFQQGEVLLHRRWI